VSKFSGVHTLDVLFTGNFGAHCTEIHFVGLKGEFAEVLCGIVADFLLIGWQAYMIYIIHGVILPHLVLLAVQLSSTHIDNNMHLVHCLHMAPCKQRSLSLFL
jgi:hypothetical protein